VLLLLLFKDEGFYLEFEPWHIEMGEKMEKRRMVEKAKNQGHRTQDTGHAMKD